MSTVPDSSCPVSSAGGPDTPRRDLNAPEGGDETRPASIEAPTNRLFIHRISGWLLAPAIRIGIHPNIVSLIGLGFGAGAGWAYAQWRDPWMATLGFVLMIGWHICDGLDGRLARATGKVTALGRLLDGICDYATFFMVLLPIALSFQNWPVTLALALTAGAAHALQSALYEGERESWIRRSRGVFAASARSNAGGWIERNYNRIESRLGNHDRPVDAWLATHPQKLTTYLDATVPVMRRLTILSANSRTVAIWVACMIGFPVGYWLWELVGLSLIAMMLAARLRNIEAGLSTGGNG